MPPSHPPEKPRSLQQIVDALDIYPIEAFEFVKRGLEHTVDRIHGRAKEGAAIDDPSRHVCGRQLCEGLRDYALKQWGMLARTVLRRWGITSTVDFGRIVFAMVDSGYLQKTEQDQLEDFHNVFDFRTAFEGEYRIEQPS